MFTSIFHEETLNEVYFGKTPEILAIEKQLSKYRSKYMGSRFNTKVNSDPDLIKLCNMIEDFFGFGIFSLYIENATIINGYTIPISSRIDYNRFSKNNVIADKKTFKFRKECDYACLVTTYSGIIFNSEFTDGEVMALILHEIGHNFNFDVHTNNTILKNIEYGIISAYNIMNPINFVISEVMNSNTVVKEIEKVERDLRKNNSVLMTLSDTLATVKGAGQSLYYLLDSLLRVGSLGILSVIASISGLFDRLTKPVTYISLIIMPGRYRDEKFSDNFATMYGYGPETASLQGKFANESRDSADVIMRNINKIPVVSTIIHAMDIAPLVLLSGFDPHPNAYVRINDQLELLEYELNKSDIDPRMRKRIKEDLVKIYKELDKCTGEINEAKKRDPYIAQKYYYKILKSLNGGFKDFLLKDRKAYRSYDKGYKNALMNYDLD